MSDSTPSDAPAAPIPLDDALDRCLALFEAFRRLGFTPEVIHFAPECVMEGRPDATGPGMALVVGAQRYLVMAGVVAESVEVITARWLERANAWNASMSEEERQAIYDRGLDASARRGLVFSLTLRGFTFGGDRRSPLDRLQ